MSLAPDLILAHGNLITLNPNQPRAASMAVRNGRIVTVGSNEEIERLAGPETRRIHLGGRTVTPGFCDSHVHFFWYGRQLLQMADLVGTRSIGDIFDRLSDLSARTAPGGWLQGHGFDQEKLKEKRFPTRAELDNFSRTRPIIISRICGHAVVVNSAALALVSKSQAAAGDPDSGLYTETSADAFYAKIPPMDETQMEEAVLAAAKVAVRRGITSVHTLLDSPEQMIAYQRLKRKGKLPLRVTGIPPYSAVAQLHAHGIGTTFGDEWLRVGAAKFFSDGSLGAHTAWLREPYADDPSTRGIRIYDPQDLNAKCRDAQSKGFQLAIHAIGDEALRETLAAILFALDGTENEFHRHRVEHASICPPDCLDLMAEHKIIATLQPQFVTSDTWTAERLGAARAKHAYPFRSMIEAGVPITLSSDCPVERMDAFAAIASAVGRHPWSAEETITPEQAIHAYCLGSAYAGHAEHYSGSLEADKVADFVVLSDDITQLASDKIGGLRAEAVFIAGQRI